MSAKTIPQLQKKTSPAWRTRTFSGFMYRNSDEVITHLKKGLPVSSFKWIEKEIDLPEAQVATLLQIASRTLARRKKEGHLQLAESERVFRLGSLFEKAIQVLGDKESAQHWFKSNKKALNGKTPLEYSDTEVGAREVEDLLGRIEHGVFG